MSVTFAFLCLTMNGQKIVIVGIYISPNSHIDDIIAFLHGSLLRYTCDGGKLLPQRDDLKPLILTGDFIVNFTLDTFIKLTDFLQQQLNLQMINDRNISTTKSGTTIDAVFSRYLDTIESRTYISYFSYHKPIVSTVAIAPATQNVQAIEAPSNVQIIEIN
ncbi:hypothetical protein PV328_011142 [Microctonus aethiopoides]|uniref:Uncharacterized protein n=1 Tax=Microctonus aethiopoides TaxID=144406 RepID=A0AA39ET87_9HYME|nr:hypothetical protein PV328_011142 [Microctonus aethiopoides]